MLAQGYTPDVFVDGPLVAALRDGGLLYVEEINRVPEETLNVLITVMSEAELTVPRLGLVRAEPGFRLVAAMNPFDAVGTERISSAIYDRTCRISMDYQSADDRVGDRRAALPAVGRRLAGPGRRPRPTYPGAPGRPDRLLGARRDRPGRDRRPAVRRCAAVPAGDWHAGLDAALVSLSGRIRMHESAGRRPEEVVRELYEQVFGAAAGRPDPDGADPGEA